MKFGISTRLIIGSILIIILTMIPLAYKTTQNYAKNVLLKEQQSNIYIAKSFSAEIDKTLKSLVDKSKILGSIYKNLDKNQQDNLNTSLNSLIMSDKDVFALDFYILENNEYIFLKSFVQSEILKKLNKSESYISELRNKKPFPILSVAQENIEIQVATVDRDLPLMQLGIPISHNEQGQVDLIAITYLQLSSIQKVITSNSGNNLVFVTDSKGYVLAHPNEVLFLSGRNLVQHPLIQKAVTENELQSDSKYKLLIDGQNEIHFGAYSKSVFGPIVVSEIPESLVFEPVNEIKRQSFLITGIVLSISIFLVFLFSLTITHPIEVLAQLISRVSLDDYSVNTGDLSKKTDEIGHLARAMDKMIIGLIERAKAYAVMRQSIGASVVSTLMNMKEEDLGGQSKTVTILFSDLRDFTKFSEGHSPEEVVKMLNEYFNVMVEVVIKNGGWLDKFIGDAIMAVWGVPYSKDNDQQLAVKAALEMRTALDKLNESRIVRGLMPLKIGIGLHTGPAIVGKIGSAERANLTVIGDSVNQASRIEAATKALGVDILLSEDLANSVEQSFVVTNVGSVHVKGKSHLLKLFRVDGYYDEFHNSIMVKTAYSEFEKESADKVQLS